MQSTYHHPRKRFGQHFLIDPRVIAHIVKAIAAQANDNLVEIGPGQGVLTQELLPLVKELTAIELDRDLILPLEHNFKHLGQLKVIQADALEFNFSTLGHPNIRLVGNLPYNISTPLLFHILEYQQNIQDMHFMLQKEVVDRLCAKVGEHSYNRLSVMIQYHCQTQFLFEVPPTAFKPPPKVDSAVVRLIPYQKKPFIVSNYLAFKDIVRIGFAHRRKTIKNNYKGIFSDKDLHSLDIDPKARPQDLKIADFVKLADRYKSEL